MADLDDVTHRPVEELAHPDRPILAERCLAVSSDPERGNAGTLGDHSVDPSRVAADTHSAAAPPSGCKARERNASESEELILSCRVLKRYDDPEHGE